MGVPSTSEHPISESDIQKVVIIKYDCYHFFIFSHQCPVKTLELAIITGISNSLEI